MKLIGLFGMLSVLLTPAWGANPDAIRLLKGPDNKNQVLGQQDVMSLERLEQMFRMDVRTPGLVAMIKRTTLRHRQKAVPTLIKVMKEDKYPEQNRWQATMLLAQVMGKKSAPFIAKFIDHPHWMMRVASLKALLGLKQENYHQVYGKALKDSSLIVRVQALDNISRLQINSLGPQVWQMLYDQSNYAGPVGNRKRTSIVKSIIRTIGDVKYVEARAPLAKLIQKPKYQDLIEDLDYSLEKITGQISPNSSVEARRAFWTKVALNESLKKRF